MWCPSVGQSQGGYGIVDMIASDALNLYLLLFMLQMLALSHHLERLKVEEHSFKINAKETGTISKLRQVNSNKHNGL